MKLPTQKSKINLNFKDQKFGMIGISGIGKSDFFAQDPNAFFIETEAGLNFVEVYKEPARSWNDLLEIYTLLKQAEESSKFPYSIIVFDTIDRVVDLAEEIVIGQAKDFYKKMADQINTIGDIPNGGGWSKTREKVANLFAKFEMLPCAVAYIGHLHIKRIDSGVTKYDKSTISLWAGVGNDMLAWPDHLLHVEAHMTGEKLVRNVYTKPTQSREAKSRGGVVPDGVKWTEDSKKNYQEFRKIFK